MRLSDVLSKAPNNRYEQIEGFLDSRKIPIGKVKSVDIGNIGLNFFCSKCHDTRTFALKEKEKVQCLGVNNNLISIDVVLRCFCCGGFVPIWFLVESDNDIYSYSPNVRILSRREKLSDMVQLCSEQYGGYTELLDKAHKAHHDELGAGSVIYLRKVFEQIAIQTATAEGINISRPNGSRKSFKELLTDVDRRRSIIPREFATDGYKLFSELSEVIHGDSDEQLGLQKYEHLRRLVIGIIDNVKNSQELMAAIGVLGWNNGGTTP